MTKSHYIEAIVDLFNNPTKGKLNDAQKCERAIWNLTYIIICPGE